MPDTQSPTNETEQLRRRNRELYILKAFAEALNREVDLKRALTTALARAAELLDLQTAWIWLLHADSGESYLACAQNLPPALVQNPRRMEGSCLCLDTYREGDLDGAANVNVLTCSRLKNLVDGTDGLRYHASIPLYAHEKQLGVLNVASTDWRELSEDDLRILHTLGDLLGMAIERARLFEHSARLGAAHERIRLARELHDTLAQGLVGVTLQLESVEALLENNADHGRVQSAIHRALDLTRANLKEARRSVFDLRAAPLEGRTLREALEELVAEHAGQSNLIITVELTGAGRPLPIRIETGIYRIAQEALQNVVRHSQARHARLEFIATPDQVTVSVADDGVGFDARAVPQERFGLVGLNERAHLLGGQLRVETAPGAGTRIEVSIPLR